VVYREEPPAAMGSFLKEPTRFDNVEFGISMKDAMSMTASTRRLIELAFLACLDSGIDSRGKRIGVFSAGTNIEAYELVRLVFVYTTAWHSRWYYCQDDSGSRGLGSGVNTLANRSSFIFDFTGPSLYADTACSSSLTAMHLAIRSIESGDCDAAIVGACQHNMK
jgi:acyl transferase domain-containing protein